MPNLTPDRDESLNERGVPMWFVNRVLEAGSMDFAEVCAYCGAGISTNPRTYGKCDHYEDCDRPTIGTFEQLDGKHDGSGLVLRDTLIDNPTAPAD